MLHLLQQVFGFLWSAGVLLVLYGVVSAETKQPWPPLEAVVSQLSLGLTLVSAGLTFATVWIYGLKPSPPSTISKFILAPLGMTGLVAVALWASKTAIPPVVMNGIATIGLAGALLRIVPRAHDDP